MGFRLFLLVLTLLCSAPAAFAVEDFQGFVRRYAREVARLAIEGEARERMPTVEARAEGYRVSARTAADVRRELTALFKAGLAPSAEEASALPQGGAVRKKKFKDDMAGALGVMGGSGMLGGIYNLFVLMVGGGLMPSLGLPHIDYEVFSHAMELMYGDAGVWASGGAVIGGGLGLLLGAVGAMQSANRINAAAILSVLGVATGPLYGMAFHAHGGTLQLWAEMAAAQSVDPLTLLMTLPTFVGVGVAGVKVLEHLVPFLRRHSGEIVERLREAGRFWDVVRAEGNLTPAQLQWAKSNVDAIAKTEGCRINLQKVNVRVAAALDAEDESLPAAAASDAEDEEWWPDTPTEARMLRHKRAQR